MRSLEVEVTQADIEAASAAECPIEIAISRTLDKTVKVGYNFAFERDNNKNWLLSKEAIRFAKNFDGAFPDKKEAKPFKFIMTELAPA